MRAESDSSESRPFFRALVLGPFMLERDGQRVDIGRWQQRVQTLFLLLVTASDRQRRRDDLMDILWPDSSPESAQGNLRILVHRLRLALGGDPSPVLSDHGWVRLNPAYTWLLDLDELEQRVQEANGNPAQLRAAVALYRGEPLIEQRYADWAIPVAERASRTWRDACLLLASIEVTHGQYDDAATWYRRLLEIDPLDEEAARGLMVALGSTDKSGEALQYFERFKERLETEIDAPPAAETLALVDRLRLQRSDQIVPSPILVPAGGNVGPPPDRPLVDRAGEMEHVLLAAEMVRAGTGRVILLAGEAGVGKTRLAQEILSQTQGQGFSGAVVRCFERDRMVAFAPFLDLLSVVYGTMSSALRAEAALHWPQLVWLLPEGAAPPARDVPEEPDQQRALFRACVGLLSTAAQDRPLAISLDDLQWADEASLALLSYVAEQTRGTRCLILGAYRDADISDDHPLRKTVRHLLREHLVERLMLSRFSPEETAALVVQFMAGATPPAEFTDFVYRRTKGNPFYIRRLVEALGGRYRLTRQIASGGMGRVFEAVDTVTGERVAAKIMFARTEADPRALLRFRQEGSLLASLHHPNVVRVHTTVVEEYASCIVMDLVEGRSLSEVIGEGPVPLARAKNIALQIAAALIAAHERDIVHRDIKPSNIMVGANDHVTVTDFGIARLIRPPGPTATSSLTSTGLSLGTPLYMAPEQIQGGRLDARADVYSFGAVLFHTVTGRPPFDEGDPVSIAYKQVHEPPPPPRAIRSDLPEEWEAVILRALAKAPDDRFQTAVAMSHALSGLSAPAPREDMRAESGTLEEVGDAGAVALSRKRTSVRIRSLVGTLVALVLIGLAGVIVLRNHVRSGSVANSFRGGPGEFFGPTGIQVDDAGNVYVVDEWNARVQKFDWHGDFIRQWGGKGRSLFGEPSDIARDAETGVLYVSDFGKRQIVVIHPNGQIARIPLNVGALAVGPHGTLFAASYGEGKVYRISRGGRRLPAWPIPMVNVGSFNYPAGMAVDGLGRLYIADRRHARIVRRSPNGKWTPIIGAGEGSKEGQLKFPTDVAVDPLDPLGYIYVADTANNRVQIFTLQGAYVDTWDLRSTPPGRFKHPSSIAVDGKGNLYVSDYGNDRVVKLTPAHEPLWYTHGRISRKVR